jgi:predicted nuclease of predicted toxin-antitoxin system
MKVLVDMNLSPAWVVSLKQAGWEATHWSYLGNPSCTDAEIMRFAQDHDWVVFTNDLDFGALLAHTRAGKPSVFQVRARDVSPGHLASVVVRVLRQFSPELESGALLSLDEAGQRVRLLPITD